ncbi:MAG: hypothetical protein M3Y39_20190 [Chloroflexota bacterium]|nr:hypothetical protein [Chloroflexota bacterium]
MTFVTAFDWSHSWSGAEAVTRLPCPPVQIAAAAVTPGPPSRWPPGAAQVTRLPLSQSRIAALWFRIIHLVRFAVP